MGFEGLKDNSEVSVDFIETQDQRELTENINFSRAFLGGVIFSEISAELF